MLQINLNFKTILIEFQASSVSLQMIPLTMFTLLRGLDVHPSESSSIPDIFFLVPSHCCFPALVYALFLEVLTLVDYISVTFWGHWQKIRGQENCYLLPFPTYLNTLHLVTMVTLTSILSFLAPVLPTRFQ